MIREAEISECGCYRWTLRRSWESIYSGDVAADIVWIMLNPSTADGIDDDPTIRRCIDFSQQWGFDELTVVNLFAFRATKPADMKAAAAPIGPENDQTIRDIARVAAEVVCAWGVHGSHLDRDRQVMRMLVDEGCEPKCLGVTKDGQPRHPLMLAKTTKLVPFQLPDESDKP